MIHISDIPFRPWGGQTISTVPIVCSLEPTVSVRCILKAKPPVRELQAKRHIVCADSEVTK